MSVLEDLDARQEPALEVLEAGTAAGGDVSERRLLEAELPHGCGRVAAADHREAGDLGQRLRYGAGALREGVDLEHAHRPVPEHRPGVAEGCGERRSRLRPDVEAE